MSNFNCCFIFQVYISPAGYFVKATNGSDNAIWWNGDHAHQIDFTNTKAATWYYTRLRNIQKKNGIDSYKFDAGETDYTAEVRGST